MSRNAVRIIPKRRPDVAGISVRMLPKYASKGKRRITAIYETVEENRSVDLRRMGIYSF
jgi:hypothetical protein